MPTFSLPYPVLPSGGDLPVRSVDDVRAVYPAGLRDQPAAPVRDALCEAAAEMFVRYQNASDYAAAQSDPTRATGMYLAAHGADRGVFIQNDEGAEAFRERLFAVPAVVTPAAILAIANAILTPYTTATAHLFESVLDRWFLSDGTAAWHTFVGDGSVDMTPDYPDRRHALRAGSSPGGPWAFADHVGRYFILRVPDITGVTDAFALAFDGVQATETGFGLFATDGTDLDGSATAFAFTSTQDAMSVYQSIVNSVERVCGHGVRWMLFVDAKL